MDGVAFLSNAVLSAFSSVREPMEFGLVNAILECVFELCRCDGERICEMSKNTRVMPSWVLLVGMCALIIYFGWTVNIDGDEGVSCLVFRV